MTIEKSWWDLLAEIRKEPAAKSFYVLGATDSGKTTLGRFLISNLCAQFKLGCIDCDPGQSVYGPPTTVGLAVFDRSMTCQSIYLRFVGAISPRGHFMQMLCSLQKLKEKAQELGLEKIIIDSSGFVLGNPAREFQFHVIESLNPDFLIALQKSDEIEEILHNFNLNKNLNIRRLAVSPAVVPRLLEERQKYRLGKFQQYFRQAKLQELKLADRGIHGMVPDLKNPLVCQNRLIALCNSHNFVIALAIIQKIDWPKRTCVIFTPPVNESRVASVQFGSIYLNPDGSQLQPNYWEQDNRYRF